MTDTNYNLGQSIATVILRPDQDRAFDAPFAIAGLTAATLAVADALNEINETLIALEVSASLIANRRTPGANPWPVPEQR